MKITDPDALIFGRSPQILECGNGLIIGNGRVIPEINFTLPALEIDETSWPEIRIQYETITHELCQRSIDLDNDAVVFEFELLPPMTLKPEWGADITSCVQNILTSYFDKHQLYSALRVTPVDIRVISRPPLMRSGDLVSTMFQSFELCGRAGADMLSIESTGGKEIHDDALLAADLEAIVITLGILAPRDMSFLWKRITEIAQSSQVLPAGDTACGFANTAMILADKNMIPRVLAAVVRVASVIRSLKAYEVGARGPSKDCAYEGPYLKVLTGIPISMEGKSSAGAHLSHIGNISGAYCDLWSNESIPNIRLLSAMAPVVSLEQLIYDCRLMNTALRKGETYALQLRDLLIESDAYLDPQGYIFKHEFIFEICKGLDHGSSDLSKTIYLVRKTLELLRHACTKKILTVKPTELRWLDMLSRSAEQLSDDEEKLLAYISASEYGNKVNLTEYPAL